MQYFCDSCGTVQYEEDLGRTQAYADEPSWIICGYCDSDEVRQLDPAEASAQLYSTIRYFGSLLGEHGILPNTRVQDYLTRCNNLCEYLEDV